MSAPTIDFTQDPNGIPGNNGAQITGIGNVNEAKDLALVLQTGALPYNFRQLEKTEISATLGKDSLQQAKRAAIGGMLIVALFLLLFYRFLGLVAVIGLAIYGAFMYAAILIFGVTLTLAPPDSTTRDLLLPGVQLASRKVPTQPACRASTRSETYEQIPSNGWRPRWVKGPWSYRTFIGTLRIIRTRFGLRQWMLNPRPLQ